MSSQDKIDTHKNTIALLKNFFDSNQRKRKNLLSKLDLAVNDIYEVLDDILPFIDKEGDDWAGGWIFQLLKKNKPEIFKRKEFDGWFLTDSKAGIDYSELQLNLLNQNFEEADRLTSCYLRKLAGKVAEKRGYVFYSEVGNMAGEDLVSIDRLWNIYSQGKFGFSIQAKLLKSVGKRYDLLWPKIGWKIDGVWTRYPTSFSWSLDAPEGHMPLVNQLRGVRLMDSILRHPSIALRHNNCL